MYFVSQDNSPLNHCTMADIKFGEIEGFPEGYHFKDRKSMMEKAFHRKWAAGIDGNGKEGAAAIVLSGGYEDDDDLGELIIYTGAGGNKDGKQVEDQSWDNIGNAGLKVSMSHGLPVRVIRGHHHKSHFSPKSGYTYAGLYSVIEAWEDIGKSGYKICKFKLAYSGSNDNRLQLTEQEILLKENTENENDSQTVSIVDLPPVQEVKISVAKVSLIKLTAPKTKGQKNGPSPSYYNYKKSTLHGNQGEHLVMEHLRQTLAPAEVSTLKHHAAENEKDGYDISYFNLNDQQVFIEVKATSARFFPNFVITINELTAAERYGAAYQIYLVNKVTSKDVNIEIVKDIAGMLEKGEYVKSPVAFKIEKSTPSN